MISTMPQTNVTKPKRIHLMPAMPHQEAGDVSDTSPSGASSVGCATFRRRTPHRAIEAPPLTRVHVIPATPRPAQTKPPRRGPVMPAVPQASPHSRRLYVSQPSAIAIKSAQPLLSCHFMTQDATPKAKWFWADAFAQQKTCARMTRPSFTICPSWQVLPINWLPSTSSRPESMFPLLDLRRFAKFASSRMIEWNSKTIGLALYDSNTPDACSPPDKPWNKG